MSWSLSRLDYYEDAHEGSHSQEAEPNSGGHVTNWLVRHGEVPASEIGYPWRRTGTRQAEVFRLEENSFCFPGRGASFLPELFAFKGFRVSGTFVLGLVGGFCFG